MTETKTSCPKCGGHIAFPTELAGQEIACPHCAETILLPQSKRTLAWVATGALALGVLCLCAVLIWQHHGKPAELPPSQVDKNPRPPLETLQEQAAKGNPEAQAALGLRYEYGQGVAIDALEMVKWYRKAAEQNVAKAQFKLGNCYAKGLGVTQDDVEAAKWYRKAAVNGHAQAQELLGEYYERGIGLEQDKTEAAKWYLKAFNSLRVLAERGDAQAQESLGKMYGYGTGVAKDLYEAAKWRRRAAEQGDPEIQYSLGFEFEFGVGVPKDFVEAAEWFHKAAEQGYARAQSALGFLYDLGDGVPKDDIEAYKWLNLANAQGVKGLMPNTIVTPEMDSAFKKLYEADENLMKCIEARITPEQIAEAQRRSSSFVAKPNKVQER